MDNKKIIIISSAAFAVILIALYLIIASKPDHSKTAPMLNTGQKPQLLAGIKKLEDEGKISEAIKLLNELIEKRPDSAQAEEASFMLASICEKSGDIAKARDTYRMITERYPSSEGIANAEKAIGDLNIKILFSPKIMEGATIYQIRKGDTLAAIAKKYGTTVDLISYINSLKDTNIKYGFKLKVPSVKFSIVVDKSQNILTLNGDGNMVKTYRASTGSNNSTPTGKFVITNRISDPTWYTTGAVVPPSSANNILGTRWLGISKKGFGIHGTTEPEKIGQSVTSGCVRLANPDVEELYMIVPEGTEVVIVD